MNSEIERNQSQEKKNETELAKIEWKLRLELNEMETKDWLMPRLKLKQIQSIISSNQSNKLN